MAYVFMDTLEVVALATAGGEYEGGRAGMSYCST